MVTVLAFTCLSAQAKIVSASKCAKELAPKGGPEWESFPFTLFATDDGFSPGFEVMKSSTSGIHELEHMVDAHISDQEEGEFYRYDSNDVWLIITKDLPPKATYRVKKIFDVDSSSGQMGTYYICYKAK